MSDGADMKTWPLPNDRAGSQQVRREDMWTASTSSSPPPAVAGPAPCGRCGHGKARHGGMPGPETGATERNNASRCGACEQGGGYCERWTACYGTFPDGPPPPASEPPGDTCALCAIPCSSQYSMSMAGVHRLCWACALIEPDAARRIHAFVTATAAAKAALEVRLQDTQEALANMTEERDMQQFHAKDVEAERDALAAQLKAVLPLLVPVDNGYRRCLRCNTHSHQPDVHRHVDGCEVRAALAASGPVKEGE